MPDTRLWPGGAAFSTAGAYHTMKSSSVVLPLADCNWSNFVPLKVQAFFWISWSLPSVQRGHHRSFAPVYVDELYSQPKGLIVVREEEPQPNTSKLARDTDRTGGGVNKTHVHGHGAGAAAATTTGGGSKARAGGRSAGVRGCLLSPGRGGCGMGEVDVDVRAEMFIMKFREEMWLQSQRSDEEFQAMLARGL
ncbi:uncharacterized protein LOC124655070 [Lolium rigidum]|uniref:uncharacterized protein LOC124655070 n=1 Tax=Lolium rigidum TaxID=89674 RepID=UPI001F5D95F6|nr:uncharacterized protein LOC124655070 [Lolium rigidum]